MRVVRGVRTSWEMAVMSSVLARQAVSSRWSLSIMDRRMASTSSARSPISSWDEGVISRVRFPWLTCRTCLARRLMEEVTRLLYSNIKAKKTTPPVATAAQLTTAYSWFWEKS